MSAEGNEPHALRSQPRSRRGLGASARAADWLAPRLRTLLHRAAVIDPPAGMVAAIMVSVGLISLNCFLASGRRDDPGGGAPDASTASYRLLVDFGHSLGPFRRLVDLIIGLTMLTAVVYTPANYVCNRFDQTGRMYPLVDHDGRRTAVWPPGTGLMIGYWVGLVATGISTLSLWSLYGYLYWALPAGERSFGQIPVLVAALIGPPLICIFSFMMIVTLLDQLLDYIWRMATIDTTLQRVLCAVDGSSSRLDGLRAALQSWEKLRSDLRRHRSRLGALCAVCTGCMASLVFFWVYFVSYLSSGPALTFAGLWIGGASLLFMVVFYAVPGLIACGRDRHVSTLYRLLAASAPRSTTRLPVRRLPLGRLHRRQLLRLLQREGRTEESPSEWRLDCGGAFPMEVRHLQALLTEMALNYLIFVRIVGIPTRT